jgi:hypothetical protein
MWHNSVEYWVCYSMFCNERTKVFPRVAWPDHGWSGTLQYGIRERTKTIRNGYWCTTPKECVQVIGMMEKKCIMDIGARKHDLPCVVVVHDKYGCTG